MHPLVHMRRRTGALRHRLVHQREVPEALIARDQHVLQDPDGPVRGRILVGGYEWLGRISGVHRPHQCWFYERRQNYYRNLGKTPARTVSIPYLAQAIMAIGLSDQATRARVPPPCFNSGLLERDAGYRRREACPAQRAPRASATLAPSSGRPGFAAPAQPEIGPESREIREIPAHADVAQLVEHFTRNEGVPGSSPGVGSSRKALVIGIFWPIGAAPKMAKISARGYTGGIRDSRGVLRRLLRALRCGRDSGPANSSLGIGVAAGLHVQWGPARPRGPP